MEKLPASPIAVISLCLGVGIFIAAPQLSRAAEFEKDIRPLLEARCLKCHGKDAQKSGLRLDSMTGALRGGDSGEKAIVPGDSTASHLIELVTTQDEEHRMPPKGDALTPAEVAALQAWIDDSPQWQPALAEVEATTVRHWSFKPVTRPEPPQSALLAQTGSENPIDAFIAARLETAGLSFNPLADRATLIRRLYLDMTGLLPSPEAVASFVADESPLAWEHLVDEILASPHYGERWARHWLDVVRYADSHGFETNWERPNAYPYRDYVIRAFNDDKPYDRFVFEQLAGDTVGEDAATGFLVAGPWDRVKGKDPLLRLQQRSDELNDIVGTTGTAFLGLTMACARCHNHKFDPVSQKDYYSMVSVFEGVTHAERPLRDAERDAERKQQIKDLSRELSPVLDQLSRYQPKARLTRTFLVDDSGPFAETPDQRGVIVLTPTKSSKPLDYEPGKNRGEFDDPGDTRRLPNVGQSYQHWAGVAEPGQDLLAWQPATAGRYRVWLSWGRYSSHAKDARYILDRDGDLNTRDDQKEIASVDQRYFSDGTGDLETRKLWSGFHNAGVHELTAASRIVLRQGDKGGATTADTLLFEEVPTAGESGKDTSPPHAPHLRSPVTHLANEESFAPVEARFVRFTATEVTRGMEPCLDELEIYSPDHPARNLALASGGAVATASSEYPNNTKHRVSHINDGVYGNEHSWISREKNGGWIQIELPRTERIGRILWGRDRGGEEKEYNDRLALAYRVEVSTDGKAWQTVAHSGDRLADAFRERFPTVLTVANLADQDGPLLSELIERQARLEKQIAELSRKPMVYAGKFQEPEPTKRLFRGDVTQPREIVAPEAIEFMADDLDAFHLPPDAPEQERRVALANWIIQPDHPLTARVMVNRLWHYHFGRGIVATPSDFGAMGFAPTHPELLDWLTSEFTAQGWSVKHLQRLILTSHTYQQSSRPEKDGMAQDAQGLLLWRFPPRRLEAEAIRDNILLVSGSLDQTMYGPGFLLFEPNDNYSRNWVPKDSFEPSDMRRMIYTLKLRMENDAVFGAFDCPDAGQIAPARSRSTTPIQALNLYNSGFMIDQAEAFASRVENETGPSPSAQAARCFELTLGRTPSPEESIEAASLVEEHGLVSLCRALYNANGFLFIE